MRDVAPSSGTDRRPKDVAIALTFDFDAFSTWIGTFGVESPGPLSRGEFGPIGVRRILALLEEMSAPATFFVPGHTARAFPRAVERIVEAGHEIGHHGWVHENPSRLTRDEEAHVLELGMRALQDVAGVRPTGYRSPSWDNSPSTIGLLLAAGFQYESSLMGGDYEPYWCRVGDEWSAKTEFRFGKPVDLVEIPVSWHLDDWPQFEYTANLGRGGLGLRAPSTLWEIWTGEFEYLYDHVGSGILSVCMHPEVIGRGHRMLFLERFMRYVAGRPGVRFTRCDDYVRRWREGKRPELPRDTQPGGSDG